MEVGYVDDSCGGNVAEGPVSLTGLASAADAITPSMQVMTKPDREWRAPPIRMPSDIVLPEPPRQPAPIRCPYPDEDYDDVNEYDDLINH
jgi:hypothetical protein